MNNGEFFKQKSHTSILLALLGCAFFMSSVIYANTVVTMSLTILPPVNSTTGSSGGHNIPTKPNTGTGSHSTGFTTTGSNNTGSIIQPVNGNNGVITIKIGTTQTIRTGSKQPISTGSKQPISTGTVQPVDNSNNTGDNSISGDTQLIDNTTNNSTTQVHNSTTQVHNSTTQVHNSTTRVHNSTTRVHNSASTVNSSKDKIISQIITPENAKLIRGSINTVPGHGATSSQDTTSHIVASEVTTLVANTSTSIHAVSTNLITETEQWITFNFSMKLTDIQKFKQEMKPLFIKYNAVAVKSLLPIPLQRLLGVLLYPITGITPDFPLLKLVFAPIANAISMDF